MTQIRPKQALPTKETLEQSGVSAEQGTTKIIVTVPVSAFWDMAGGLQRASSHDVDLLVNHMLGLFGINPDNTVRRDQSGGVLIFSQDRDEANGEDIDYEPLHKSLGLKTAMAKEALKQSLENIQLFDRKQQDYGSRNISESGEIGLVVRLRDKVNRIDNLLAKGEIAPNCEPVLDGYCDISNYGLIGQLVRKGVWK